uniref:Legume lectin domain-containing protein n=2 Tax=Oryza TaxID=4527 RepID=A0A0E0P4G5_ORYRU
MELLLLVLLLAVSGSPAMADVVSYSFAAVGGGRAASNGLVVATNSSILSPATFLFDAQLFPEKYQMRVGSAAVDALRVN